ncbi:MAG: phage tail sheath subtilisin-like domain-containing protein [Bacteroidetes bacterium]|nr:phage tail sheath subtilisin-like domain-containing protein [Bacteroidota bacterium]
MPQFLSPGVVVEEVQGKNATIPASSTSAMALAGYSTRGPEGKATVTTNFTEFVRRFGSFSSKSMNTYAVAAYFQNGGNRVWFVRELASDATFAEGVFTGTWDVKASGRGSWANGGEVSISGNPSFFNGETGEYSRFDFTVEIINPNTGLLEITEQFEALDLVDEESPDYITKVLEVGSEDIILSAISGGIPAGMSPTPFSGVVLGAGDGTTVLFNASVSGNAPILEGSCVFKVNGVQVAIDNGLGSIQDDIGGASVSGTVNYQTGAVSIFVSPAVVSGNITIDGITRGADSVTVVLAGGSDGSVVQSSDVIGAGVKALGRGIYALDEVNEQFALALPDFAGDSTTESLLVTYAEERQDIVALVQPPKGSNPQEAIAYRRKTLGGQSSYAAMYYPWVKVPDPLNRNRPKTVPPAGHIAGRYAYTDITENVGKAPAGVNRGQLRFLSGVERVLTKGDRDSLYPAQVNPIVSDDSIGVAIFGNKTLQVVGDFTDVNIRRTFINLRKEQEAGLVDILFENIGPATFSLIVARLDQYLEGKFLAGVIGSGVPLKEQAFKVVCDETNNPESIQIQKRIVIDEFIKPNLAAEFIHLRLQRVFDASEA